MSMFFMACGRPAGVRPPYKRRLAYIEQTGTQYINTGIIARSGLKTEVRFIPGLGGAAVDNDVAGVAQTSPTVVRFFAPCLYQGMINYGYIERHITTGYTAGNDYTVHCDFSVGSQSMAVNGTTVYTGNNANSFNTNQPIFLMLRNQGGSPRTISVAHPKIPYFKVWDENDTLLFDGIPVMDWNDQPAMYDNVSKKLFYSPDGAAFGYGELPIPASQGVWLSSGGAVVSSAMAMTYAGPIRTGNAVTTANVYASGVLVGASVGYWGTVNVSNGGALSAATLYQDGGNVYVSSGGVANDTVISHGRLTVSHFGIASGIVLSGGSLVVMSAGTALAVTSNAGVVVVNDGGYIEYVNQ